MSDKLNIGRRQSIRYIDEDNNDFLLTFNSLERGNVEEDCPKTNSFLYNDEEDVYRINSKKLRATERINSNNSEKIDEVPENSHKITKENNDNKNLNSKNFLNLNLEEKLNILFAIMISYLIFCIIELFFAYYSNSLVLMADAAHYFSESIYFCIYIIIISISRKKVINNFYKSEIISVIGRSTFLLGFSFWLVYYIIRRFMLYGNSNGLTIIILGIISLFFSIIMELVLILVDINNNVYFSNKQNNLTQQNKIKKSFNNIWITCVTIICGILVYFFPLILYIDPSCTLLFTLILFYKTYSQISKAIEILMEESPLEFDVDRLKADLMNIKGVKKVYDIEVLNLGAGKIYMNCHLITSDPQNSLSLAKSLIKTKYNINNSTVEVELDNDKKE